ncbi:assimilatory nitrate reductase electron transfer subunit [Saccharothrix ecbatanensis]|jgi:assimilatory nitrate reductase electron transfer subunit|uniref:Assimilatory nitrate reductase electron transfer subunit n=1 Tax=Saccharothrix ecbatanensis TaxID=1105145 RepID=A0A7W9M577_9PSEU|nr:FAD-dependent oxidoreductase [Saccharothrix ecbatanensis]MBB5807793.1 assimilatory nitrate reductase electron transfer subunit [Saccharothrix ecbatanensis]
MRNVVIVGYGMAGARLADEIRRRDPKAERVAVTVLGDESHPAYNRVLLSSVVAGSLTPEAVRLHDPEWAARHHIDLRLGGSVSKIDRTRRVVHVDDDEVPYDSLVLATGARSWVPPTDGLLDGNGTLASGVVAFRSLDDCARIVDKASPGTPVAVLGGGLLGLEAARGLAGRGCLVTVVHPVGHLMERQLDPGAGRVLATTLRGLGIEFRLGVLATKYTPGEGLELNDGTHVPADLVVVSAGVRAETGLAEQAGIDVDRGVLVDDALRSSDPRVHAIGDCAQHVGTVSGLVQPAWEQAAVLADRLTGAAPAARYSGTTVVTRLKARDVDLAALGDVHVGVDSADDEVLCFQDPARGRYAKLVLRGDKVTGAIVIGAPDAAAAITQLFDRGLPAPTDRLALLLGRALPAENEASPADLPASAVVCRCNTVSKSQLVSAWRGGAKTVSAIAEVTRASTGCGGCKDAVCGIVDWLAASQPQSA